MVDEKKNVCLDMIINNIYVLKGQKSDQYIYILKTWDSHIDYSWGLTKLRV